MKSTWVPPGHPYSPIPDHEWILEERDDVFMIQDQFYAVDLKIDDQLELLNGLLKLMKESPFSSQPNPSYRYFYDNSGYSYGDGLMLYALLRWLKPRRIIEVGGGDSTSMILDVNDMEFDDKIEHTLVASYSGSIPGQFKSEAGVEVIDLPVHDVDIECFKRLGTNDLLLINSSHVSKVGSDVNCLIHEVLPQLATGVCIQFHDIFANFEYPAHWIREGRSWNESYILRSFLMYNHVFEVFMFNTYMAEMYRPWFEEQIPMFLKNPGGSLWLRKVG